MLRPGAIYNGTSLYAVSDEYDYVEISTTEWPAHSLRGKIIKLQDSSQVWHSFTIEDNTIVSGRERITLADGPNLSNFVANTTPYAIDTNAIFTYHTDAQGNVVAMTNALGTLIEKMQYDAYGRLTGLWVLDHGPISPVNGFISTETYYSETITGNPYLFQSQRLDPETGLYYFKNRYYDPVHGRFISRDPQGFVDGPNLYAFVNNNPINFIDPMGLYVIVNQLDPDSSVEFETRYKDLLDSGIISRGRFGRMTMKTGLTAAMSSKLRQALQSADIAYSYRVISDKDKHKIETVEGLAGDRIYEAIQLFALNAQLWGNEKIGLSQKKLQKYNEEKLIDAKTGHLKEGHVLSELIEDIYNPENEGAYSMDCGSHTSFAYLAAILEVYGKDRADRIPWNLIKLDCTLIDAVLNEVASQELVEIQAWRDRP
jgi:RHS repeat-associated protein